MDGAVIHFKDKSKRKFKIVGESKAGEKQSKEFNLNQSKLIYTGAPIPGNLKKLVIHQAKLANSAKLDALVVSAHEVKDVKKNFKGDSDEDVLFFLG